MKCPFVIKVCNKCKRILVAYSGNFPKNKGSKYGVENECKKCRKEYKKEYRKQNKEKIKGYKKVYQKQNEEKIKERKRKWYEENKEEFLEKRRQYYEENKEKVKERKRKYYEKNKEKIKEYQKKYREENPHVKINSHNKRKKREENQGTGITKEQWLDMMEFFNWECAYSGEYIGSNSKNRTIDHIIPLDKGGEHEVWNLVPMHLSYNSSKRNKNMEEWYQQQEFYSKERLNKIYEWIEYAKNKYNK